ncbi:MAG: ABC transporter substrate-binding protein [Eubacteriales bacterium]|nr:ABC transporter substrate-binding protein [Eubacteriales bacterium]
MKKLLASLLAFVMLFGMVAMAMPVFAEEAEEETAEEREAGVLVIAYQQFSQKFTPFYADTVYDRDVADMTQISLITNDREGNLILNGIEGETNPYNGVDYFYSGAADTIIEQGEDTTTYTFKLRPGMVFSDGEPVTADDVIFTMYAYSDPTYTGSSTFYSVPILGMQDYRTQTSSEVHDKYMAMYEAIVAAGPDYEVTEADEFTPDLYASVHAMIEQGWTDTAQSIVDYVFNKYNDAYSAAIGKTADEVAANDGLKVALGMALWGFASYDEEAEMLTVPVGEENREFDLNESFPTIQDYVDAGKAAYDNDYKAFYDVENTGETHFSYEDFRDTFIREYGSQDESMGEGGVPTISGITKVDDLTVQVVTEGFDASAIYKLGVQVHPMHYYGNPDLYDYENNQFGFPFGDLSSIIAKNTEPMGAGAYIFKGYENRTVYFEANPLFYKGEPKIKNIQFKETNTPDFVKSLTAGTTDVADPSFNDTTIEEIKSENSNGELVGDKLTTFGIDTLGYGYIGINAGTVNVAGEADSDASKNLRKGYATILASMRDLANDSYYGERAQVINYPISNTSWAAPKPADEGYEVAFSKDVEGNEIYAADMDHDAKVAAAVEAAIGYFKAAGYTWDEEAGKFTAAPEGAKLEYEVIVPAEGTGDHPAFSLVNNAKAALESIGLGLKINDPADSNELWDSLSAGTQELWTAAWGATIDPDMYQIYHSSNVAGLPGSTESNHYHIQDAELDQLIMDARKSADQDYRKTAYKACLDIIMDWAVEIPNYQRQDCIVFSSERVNIESLPQDMTTFYGWMAEIETLELNAQ